MLFVKSLFNWYEQKSAQDKTPKIFSSIDDLPQWNWVQVHKTGNLAYIKKLNSYRNINEDNSLVLEQVWLTIYDEYLTEFGLSKEYKEILERKKQIARMKNEFIMTDNRALLNFIKIEELELEATFDKSETMGFESVVVAIEKVKKFKIDIKKITVFDFNNYIRTLKG